MERQRLGWDHPKTPSKPDDGGVDDELWYCRMETAYWDPESTTTSIGTRVTAGREIREGRPEHGRRGALKVKRKRKVRNFR